MESELLVIEETSNTLDEAKKLASSKVPEDFEIMKQDILAEGRPERIIQIAHTQEEAQEKALAILPADARDAQITLSPEQVVNEQVEAHSETDAKYFSKQLRLPGAELLQMTLWKPGRKKFLMIEAVPGMYKLEIRLPVKCEVAYTPKARVRITARLKPRFRILEILNSSGTKDEKNHLIRELLKDRKIVDKIGKLAQYRRGGVSYLMWCKCGYPLVPSLLDLQKVQYLENDMSSFRYDCPQCHAFALEENYD
jgi:hypothetical protein